MTSSASDGVRPTRRVLDSLGVPIPVLTTLLHEVTHPLVAKAQSVPRDVASGGGERIRSLSDRVWFKVKRARQRGACTQLRADELNALTIPHPWWLGAAGTRTADSRTDFYAQLAAYDKDSTELLPSEWDRRRLEAEAATLAVRVTRAALQEAVSRALVSGDIIVVRLGERDVRVRIRVMQDGEAYLAISFVNSMDPEFITTVLDAIPGVDASDWQPEPSSPLHLVLEPGEMIFSTLLSIEVQRNLAAHDG